MTRYSSTLTATAAILLAMLAGAWGQEPAPRAPEAPEPPQAVPEEPASRESSGDLVRFGSGVSVERGDRVDDLVVVLGDAQVAGHVRGDAVVVLGALSLSETARIDGDVVVVGGELKVQEGAVIDGELVLVGGQLDAPPDFSPRGEQVILETGSWWEVLSGPLRWLTEGLLLGRLIVADQPFSWLVFAIVAIVFLIINLVFEPGVRSCAANLRDKPITTGLAGMLVALLAGPVTFLLAISLVGLPLIPLVWFVLFFAGVFGSVGVVRGVGSMVVSEDESGDRMQAARSVGIGLALLGAAFLTPVLGLTSFLLLGMFGTGASARAILIALRGEHPVRPVPPEGVPAHETAPDEPQALPVAGFASRAGAVALDVILVVILCSLVDPGLHWTALVLLIYHVALWTAMSTTVGGIICRIRVVRGDQTSVQFGDALVRGLASIFSVAVAGLGWFWMLWDPMRQTWHDRIANTYVVRVPAGTPEGPSSPADRSAVDRPADTTVPGQ